MLLKDIYMGGQVIHIGTRSYISLLFHSLHDVMVGIYSHTFIGYLGEGLGIEVLGYLSNYPDYLTLPFRQPFGILFDEVKNVFLGDI